MGTKQNTQKTGVHFYRSWWIILILAALMVFGCEKDVVNTTMSDEPVREDYAQDNVFKNWEGETPQTEISSNDIMEDVIGEAIILPEFPDWVTHYFKLSRVKIEGDMLHVSVTYSGGCRRHYFRLVVTDFLERKPVQVNAQIFHFNNDDVCDQIVTEKRVFDLSPLKDLYMTRFEKTKGTILINLSDGFSTAESAPLIYAFGDADTDTPPPGDYDQVYPYTAW